MHRIYGITAGFALLATSAVAQDTGADKVKLKLQMEQLEKMVATSKIFTVNGGVMGKTVKGAPYSGQEINENSQVLGDGTRIHNESRATVYRDSEGRVRRESGDTATIWDPVANATYTLDTKNMTAVKLPMPPAMFERRLVTANAVAGGAGAGGRGASPTVSVKDGIVTYTKDGKTQTFPMPANGEWVSEDGKARVSHMVTGGAAGAGPGTVGYAVREGQMIVTSSDGKTTSIPMPPPEGQGIFENRIHIGPPGATGMATTGGDFAVARAENANFKTDALGDQVIEGVKSHGTRTTSTIPEGAIGNDRPLNSTTERWYSDELQTDVVTKRSDPRSGEQNFRLININRSEPSAYLFQVPSGYTVTDRK